MNVSLLLAVLQLANQVLSSAILITAFSLLIYTLRHSFRSGVGRAFSILLASVLVVYLGDVAILWTQSPESALIWLKFQWVGIAFVPSVYLHFSDALLNVTSSVSRWRRRAVLLSYAGGAVVLLLVLFTPLIVRDSVLDSPGPRLLPGPLFWPFALYFFAVVVVSAANIVQARARCLTSTFRRRMGYLALSFVGPALGVFPYMLLTTLPAVLSEPLLLAILLVGNVGVAVMIVVLAYTVAYFGAFNPDRVIKYSLIEYILRGPLLASLVLVIVLTVPRVENFLGLPGDAVTLFAITLTILLMPTAISLLRPFLNRLVYRQDLEEITWLQELDKRLLTPSDLEQFLENVLLSLVELLRVRCAFVVTPSEQPAVHLEAHCGEERVARAFLAHNDLSSFIERYQRDPDPSPEFQYLDGYALRPLCTRNQDAVLGLLVVERWSLSVDLDDESVQGIGADVRALIEQAEVALEDNHLQQGIFVALQQIMPDIERIQKRRQLMRYVTSMPRALEESPVDDPAFSRWVKDALSHYWGGPKLTNSPLLKLTIVNRAQQENGGDAVRALRAVLQQAIEALRPLGRQSMTAVEWTLYNILDLKFREGHKMSDIARRLAISESDLYRKQKAAIDEVSRVLAQMERQALSVG
jgi:hypothetical protein